MEIGIFDHRGKLIGTRKLTRAELQALPPMPVGEAEQEAGWSVPCEGEPWYILRVAPQWERQVRNRLTDRKFNAYVPLVDTMMRGPRALKRVVARPLFPGYTFLSGGVHERVEEIRAERGVIDFLHLSLRKESFFVTLPHAAIVGMEHLSRLESRKNIGERKRNHGFKAKDKVFIVDGPFAGLPAEVANIDKAGGITVWIRMFGRLTPKQVEADEIRAA